MESLQTPPQQIINDNTTAQVVLTLPWVINDGHVLSIWWRSPTLFFSFSSKSQFSKQPWEPLAYHVWRLFFLFLAMSTKTFYFANNLHPILSPLYYFFTWMNDRLPQSNCMPVCKSDIFSLLNVAI